MKLASLKGGRDGRLVVVSNDLAWFTDAGTIAPTLQAALDDWAHCEPLLRGLAESLEHGAVPKERFHEHDALSPLPRGYQWVDGSAYVNHVQLVRQARGAEMPETFWTDPLMYQGASDGFLAPRDTIPLADSAWGCDLEGEIAVIVGDVPLGASRDEALAAIQLVMLCNDVSLRNLIPAELAKGFGFVQSKPASAFSPVAVSPDALPGWKDGKLHGALLVELNGEDFGCADAGVDMTFDFGTLVAHAAKTRPLCAGTIVGSGTVSNRGPDGGPGKPVSQGGVGYSCLAELRTVETILTGAASTPFLMGDDTIRIEMKDARGHTIFGAIEQTVERV
ncbi:MULTISPECIES: fumarylacetoacetate hydrolase family protein [unclassified Caulobacter]|uniref:fumarylacetoacetate hydrolase family protein n=1 Tax=unclassified Caulobacter TaxID=2648921 RepID=UPI000D3C3379|nr:MULTISPECIES: fumarylacetoacetate hydrolase family protein [unclassified Caulobacter]PTS87779.1 2-keto-4-pentenoate hydratase [Caulobacter sp. HMWF009]PTT05311.1 2-keto-4-pentenoate hydratase [Caulobacter sp. HMWF025]